MTVSPEAQLHAVAYETELDIIEAIEEWGDDIEASEITVEEVARRTALAAAEAGQ